MSTSEKLLELQQLLASGLISKRKVGIEMAAQMLANNLYPNEVRAHLERIAQNDLMSTVQAAARAVLADEHNRRNPRPPASPDYLFDVRCPKGHISQYDKRECCSKSAKNIWRSITTDKREVYEILLRCKSVGCGEEFYVNVDCKGYE